MKTREGMARLEREIAHRALVNGIVHAVKHKIPTLYDARDMHLAAVVERLERLEAYRTAVAAELRELGMPHAAQYVEGREP